MADPKTEKQGKNNEHLAEWQFKPGQSGNPGGRPRGSLSLLTILRHKLSEGDGERAKEIVEALLEKAKAGDAKLLIELLNRIDGKVPDKQIITGDMGAPVAIANMTSEQLRELVEAGQKGEDDDRGESEDGSGDPVSG